MLPDNYSDYCSFAEKLLQIQLRDNAFRYQVNLIKNMECQDQQRAGEISKNLSLKGRYTGRPANDDGRSEVEINTYNFLDSLGISYETLCHDAAFTMEECLEGEKNLGAPICKNLFLCNRQQTQFYLLMLPGEKHFKTKFLSSELGCARLSFASGEQMTELLGISPGSVSPMGLMNDKGQKVLLVVDNELMNSKYIGCHPCVNTATLKIKMSDLLDKIVPATNHTYKIVTLRTEE